MFLLFLVLSDLLSLIAETLLVSINLILEVNPYCCVIWLGHFGEIPASECVPSKTKSDLPWNRSKLLWPALHIRLVVLNVTLITVRVRLRSLVAKPNWDLSCLSRNSDFVFQLSFLFFFLPLLGLFFNSLVFTRRFDELLKFLLLHVNRHLLLVPSCQLVYRKPKQSDQTRKVRIPTFDLRLSMILLVAPVQYLLENVLVPDCVRLVDQAPDHVVRAELKWLVCHPHVSFLLDRVGVDVAFETISYVLSFVHVHLALWVGARGKVGHQLQLHAPVKGLVLEIITVS